MRDVGAAQNGLKCPELGLQLFDFFIHNVEILNNRADSVLLMGKARALRAEMINEGVPEGDLPMLDGAPACIPQWPACIRR